MDAKEKKMLLLGFGGILWFLAILLGYAYTHKSFSPEQIFGLLRALWQTFIGIGIASLMGALGAKLFPIIQEEFPPLVALAIHTALGLGVSGLFIFLLGVSVGFSIFIFSILFVTLIIFLRKEIFAWWKSWHALSPILEKSTAFEKTLAVGVFLILFTSFAKSLAPPLAFDSLVYHLTLPKIYLLEGGISYTPDLIFWGMPQIQEMGQTFAMALAGAESAIVFSWMLGVLTLAALFGYLNEKISSRAAWVGVVSLLTGYSLSDSLSWGYVGWATMLYGLSFFLLLDLWRTRRENKFLWISAFLLGFSVGVKYTTVILAVGAIPIIFLTHGKSAVKSALRDVLIFGAIAFLTFSPWLIKNFLATGNPFYPLLFPSGAMDVYRLELYQGDTAWGDWRDAIFLPWRATIWGVSGKAGYSAGIGSLLLALSPFSMIGWHKRSEKEKQFLLTAFILTLAGFITWALAGRTSRLLIQTRLYLAFFPAWAILAGVGFDNFYQIRTSEIRFGRIVSALVILAFSFNIFFTSVKFTKLSVMETLIGTQTRADYREQALGAYERAMSSIAELPTDARILMLWETRGFSCIPNCEPDEIIDRWYADFRIYGSEEAVLENWRAAGYTHLLFFNRGAEFIEENDSAYSSKDWMALEKLLKELHLLEDIDDSYQLFYLE